ncbi:hypothetical protein NMY22_g19670 [Coprinellus aureogranulatus]|nr:hypothetical protein NMY22_g19670 [Coprinellus aureogranulatus]
MTLSLIDVFPASSYRPRDLAIFLAGHLYHALDEWEPRAAPAKKGVTPGRASTVLFFPANSYERLKGKPKFWSVMTMSGHRFKESKRAAHIYTFNDAVHQQEPPPWFGYPSRAKFKKPCAPSPLSIVQGSAEHVDYDRPNDQRGAYASDSSKLPSTSTTMARTTNIVSTFSSCVMAHPDPILAIADTDSDRDVYAERPAPSSESLGPPPRPMHDSGIPTPTYDCTIPPRDAYPAWSADPSAYTALTIANGTPPHGWISTMPWLDSEPRPQPPQTRRDGPRAMVAGDEQHDLVRSAAANSSLVLSCADDYYQSPESQNTVEPVLKGLCLRIVIHRIRRFLRNYGWEVLDAKFVRRGKNRQDIKVMNDANQLSGILEALRGLFGTTSPNDLPLAIAIVVPCHSTKSLTSPLPGTTLLALAVFSLTRSYWWSDELVGSWTSYESYPSSPPSIDHNGDPSHHGRRYYDNESAEHVDYNRPNDQRETYASDSSNPTVNEYDNGQSYEYRQRLLLIPTPIEMSTQSVQHRPQSL